MPTSIPSPTLTIHPNPLTQLSFSPFGTVIECPLPPSASSFPFPPSNAPNVVPANQNTALKYLDVTHMLNHYASAPSQIPSKAVMNMFSCFPRALRTTGTQPRKDFFDVTILERHPYTTQTFIPLSPPSSMSPVQARYLLIVAPTLPATPRSPFNEMRLPDLDKVQAFWAHRGQAVTYGAGTWHAPMVVVGAERTDFVVVQFANGVVEEDCQEVVFKGSKERGGVSVEIENGDEGGRERVRL